MRMQKEEKIVLVLLFMALGSLAVSWWAFAPDQSAAAASGESREKGNIQTGVSLEGSIISIKSTQTGEHLLLKLDSTALPVFISRNAGAKELSKLLEKGDRIKITGIQKDYQGQQEIEVTRISDVEILN